MPFLKYVQSDIFGRLYRKQTIECKKIYQKSERGGRCRALECPRQRKDLRVARFFEVKFRDDGRSDLFNGLGGGIEPFDTVCVHQVFGGFNFGAAVFNARVPGSRTALIADFA